MRIVVVGATGFIGSHIARRLIVEGHDVVPVARNAAGLARLYPDRATSVCDLETADAANWRAIVDGAETVINAVGIVRERRTGMFDAVHVRGPARLFEACAAARVRRIIQVSANGADAASSSVYLRTKGEAEQLLDDLAAAQPETAVTILRPSLVYGPGGGSTALFAALAALPIAALPGSGAQRLQPVHVEDLAEAVARLLSASAPAPRRIEAVGPHAVTYAEMLGAYGRWLGRRRLPTLALPTWTMTVVTWLGTHLTDAPITPDTWRMLQAGNIGDPRAFAALLGRPPATLDEGLARHPATPAERRHARLYMLGRPLRWSLALLWILSGLVSIGFATESFALLERAGFPGQLAIPLLGAAVTLDIAIGAVMFRRRKAVGIGAVAIAVMLAYTGIITVTMPEMWLHPFAPIVKNVPLAVATLVMMAWEA